jgi:hypothetical protein
MNVGPKALRQTGESEAISAAMRDIPTLDKAHIRRKSDGASEPVEAANTTHDWGPSLSKSAIPSFATK